MASRRKARILAFQALYSWELSRTPLADLLAFSWLEEAKRSTLDEPTATFSRLLVSGALENLEYVDGLIKKHLKNWDFSRLNKVDLAILRMSVYALAFQNDVPASIIIDEAIDISKEFGSDESYRFVNGVLDAVRKTLDAGKGESGPAAR